MWYTFKKKVGTHVKLSDEAITWNHLCKPQKVTYKIQVRFRWLLSLFQLCNDFYLCTYHFGMDPIFFSPISTDFNLSTVKIYNILFRFYLQIQYGISFLYTIHFCILRCVYFILKLKDSIYRLNFQTRFMCWCLLMLNFVLYMRVWC